MLCIEATKAVSECDCFALLSAGLMLQWFGAKVHKTWCIAVWIGSGKVEGSEGAQESEAF